MTSLEQWFDDAGVTVVGIGGSRDPGAISCLALGELFASIGDRKVHVGDARGIDELVRGYVPRDRRIVYEADTPRVPANLVRRTVNMVNILAAAGEHGVFVALPDTSIPLRLAPDVDSRKCFAGQQNEHGRASGTWKALAYAAGLRERRGYPRCLLFLPDAPGLPARWPGWSFIRLEGRPTWWELVPGA